MGQFNFTNRRGQTLAGRLELPQAEAKASAIFAHCFTCSKNVKAASQISRSLAQLGLAVLRFDFTGLGNSEGDFANTNFSSNVADLIDAANALAEEFIAPGLLVGHSLGGAAALIAASQIDSVGAVATVGAPSEPAHVQHLFGDAVARINSDGEATIQLGGRDITIAKQFLEDLRRHSLEASLRKLRKPVLIFHSPVDSVVSIENARQIYEAAKHPKSFVAIDNADHMLSRFEDARFVSEVLASWASRYVDLNEAAY
jgi:putative redox protein